MGWCRSLCGKAQFLRELRARTGFPGAFFAKRFEFRSREPIAASPEWKNIEQLEAVVEFYVNLRPDPVPAGADTWGDPWAARARPLDSSDPNYIRVNLGLLQGSNARVTAAAGGNVVRLDDDADLADVIVNPPNANNPFIGAAAAPNLPRPQKFLYDTLWLEGDSRRPTKLYRIMRVDDATKEVTLDDRPDLHGRSSAWKLHRRPIIVVIDPLGARRVTGAVAPFATTVWEGRSATIDPADPNHPTWTVLRLNAPPAPAVAPPLDQIDPGVDTIYLPDDGAGATAPPPARTYRIMKVYPGANRTIAVEGRPVLPATGSPWQIPAGLSGVTSYLEHNLAPPPGGFRDQYDALLVVVHRGQVQQIYRFSSFTSRWQVGGNLSSLRGNRRYAYGSYRSPPEAAALHVPLTNDEKGAKFRNYNFQIVDAAPAGTGLSFSLPADAIARARFYFETQVPPGTVDPVPHVTWDANGKAAVRFHRGTRSGNGSGSAGCSVSPDFALMRSLLVKLYERDFREYYGVTQAQVDPEVNKLNPSVGAAAQVDLNDRTVDRNHAHRAQVDAQNNASETLWQTVGASGLTGDNWNGKLVGNAWFIRPDEPPVA